MTRDVHIFHSYQIWFSLITKKSHFNIFPTCTCPKKSMSQRHSTQKALTKLWKRQKIILQVSWFGDWIKCTKKNAEKYTLSHRSIERRCDTFDEPFPATPAAAKCDQEGLFQENTAKENCFSPPFGPECFGEPQKPEVCKTPEYDEDYYS